MKYSLIIPTYNRADLIGQTLQTALGQSRPFDEIIIVDDGSTDETEKLLKNEFGQVRYVRTVNQGVQKARNIGVDTAQGDRVVFCDSDDLLDQDYLLIMDKWLKNHPDIETTYANFSTFGARPLYPDKFFAAPEGFFDGATLADGFYVDDSALYLRSIEYPHMWVTGMTMKKIFYQKIAGFDEQFKGIVTEDWEFNLRAISEGSVARCRFPLVRVRYHTGSQSDSSVRTHLGAAKVLDYSMCHHRGAQKYVNEITDHISTHSTKAFNAAYAEGRFELALQALRLPYLRLSDRKFEVKKWVLRLPEPLRKAAWSLTQKLSTLRQGSK
jgi:glycosyltransferase involved in cell wall biosynthesis